MGRLEINYKYRVGQVVYFMYQNQVRKGIVQRIEIECEAGPLKTRMTEKIVGKLVKILDKDYPFKTPRIRYTLDLVSKEGKFESTPHILFEPDVFESKEELLQTL